MRSVLLDLFKEAKEVLENGSELPIIAFILGEEYVDEIIDTMPLSFDSDEEKLKTFFVLGEYCRENQTLRVILSLLGCSRPIPRKKEEKKYFFDNLEIERATLYPDSLRENFIILQYIDFAESDRNLALFAKYDKKDGKYVFDKPITTKKFESPLVEMIENGWNEMDEEINSR